MINNNYFEYQLQIIYKMQATFINLFVNLKSLGKSHFKSSTE